MPSNVLLQYRKEEAAKSLQLYRGKTYEIEKELSEILKQNEAKNNKIKASGAGTGHFSVIKRIFSPAFGRPYLVVGVLQLLNSWGVYTILMLNMIDIFHGSATSIPADQAPVYGGILHVKC